MNSAITRDNPTCFIFLIDQSHSMAQSFGEPAIPTGIGDVGKRMTKAEGVAQALNNLLRNLIITCSKSDGVRNYFEIAVIGYGATVGPAWSGPLQGRYLVPIKTVANNFARMADIPAVGADGIMASPTRLPIWVDPHAGGSTPMCQALDLCSSVLYGFFQMHPYCFPPVVVHITDGEATDGDPAAALNTLSHTGSNNGRTTLFNVHLSSSRSAVPISFPDTPEGLPDPYARLLFNTATPLSPFMRSIAWNNGMAIADDARAFVLNADPTMMVMALDIGTQPGRLR